MSKPPKPIDYKSAFSEISARNIWYMKRFFEKYQEDLKMQTLSAQISWSANTLIMVNCESLVECA